MQHRPLLIALCTVTLLALGSCDKKPADKADSATSSAAVTADQSPDEKISALEDKVTELEDRIDKLESDVSEHDDKLQEMDSSLDTANTDISDLQTKQHELDDDVDDIKLKLEMP